MSGKYAIYTFIFVILYVYFYIQKYMPPLGLCVPTFGVSMSHSSYLYAVGFSLVPAFVETRSLLTLGFQELLYLRSSVGRI